MARKPLFFIRIALLIFRVLLIRGDHQSLRNWMNWVLLAIVRTSFENRYADLHRTFHVESLFRFLFISFSKLTSSSIYYICSSLSFYRLYIISRENL